MASKPPIAAIGLADPKPIAHLRDAVGVIQALLGGTLEISSANASGTAEVRGRGLMCGIAFEDPEAAGKIAAAAFERHLMVETSGPSDEVVKLLPPLTVTDEEIDEALRILTESVAAVRA